MGDDLNSGFLLAKIWPEGKRHSPCKCLKGSVTTDAGDESPANVCDRSEAIHLTKFAHRIDEDYVRRSFMAVEHASQFKVNASLSKRPIFRMIFPVQKPGGEDQDCLGELSFDREVGIGKD
jgi:hypothetical protein